MSFNARPYQTITPMVSIIASIVSISQMSWALVA
jgi:hypothetical protein